MQSFEACEKAEGNKAKAMTPQAELRKLVEFVEFTTDNLAVVLERIEELAKQNLIPAYRLALPVSYTHLTLPTTERV